MYIYTHSIYKTYYLSKNLMVLMVVSRFHIDNIDDDNKQCLLTKYLH